MIGLGSMATDSNYEGTIKNAYLFGTWKYISATEKRLLRPKLHLSETIIPKPPQGSVARPVPSHV
jgi:hypothetical protein